MVRRPWFVRTALLALALAAVPASAPAAPADRDSALVVYQTAMGALAAGDYAAYTERMRDVDRLLPHHPAVLRRIAGGEALQGHADAAFAALDRFLALDVDHDLAADSTFASLRTDPRFAGVLERLAALRKPIETSTVAFTLPEKDLLAEGIAFDPAGGRFFVSSVHLRKILVVEGVDPARPGPASAIADFAHPGGPLAPLGLAVDLERGRLWAAATALPQAEGFEPEDDGRTALVGFDLASGSVTASFVPPDSGAHGFNDVTVAGDGTVFVSDPRARRVYRLPPGASALEPLTSGDDAGGVNGLALSADGALLYASDYGRGLVSIRLSDGSVSELPGPDTLCLIGVDGLLRAGNDLIAVQNGLRPHRVLRLRLSPDGSRIAGFETLDRNHPRMIEPTLGVAAGPRLFYVANSQWPAFGDDGSVAREDLEEPVVLSRPLR